MKKFALMLSLAGLLAGCSEEIRREVENDRINALADRCAAYGFQRGSPQMASCVQQLDMAGRQSDAATNAYMLNQGLQMMNQPPVMVQQQQPSGMNCRRMPNGSVDCVTR